MSAIAYIAHIMNLTLMPKMLTYLCRCKYSSPRQQALQLIDHEAGHSAITLCRMGHSAVYARKHCVPYMAQEEVNWHIYI